MANQEKVAVYLQSSRQLIASEAALPTLPKCPLPHLANVASHVILRRLAVVFDLE